MVDRIDKIKPTETWKIQESNPSRDKRQQSDEEKQQEAQSSFEEKPDWSRLISKDPSEKSEAIQLFIKDVKSILFKSLTNSRDQSTLEAEVLLQDGTQENSVMITLGRAQGMKLVHYKPGQDISLDFFDGVEFLQASILLNRSNIENIKTNTDLLPTRTQEGASRANKADLQNFKTKSEIALLITAALLIFVLFYLIFRLFV